LREFLRGSQGHTGLEGNERADYWARTIARYNTTITYDALPVSRGKQLLEKYYAKIWDATYVNSAKDLPHQITHPLHLP